MDNPTKAKPSRLWRTVLVTSLALNLIVVGVVVGAALSGRIGHGAARTFDLGVGPMARALSHDERRALGRSMRGDTGLRRADMRGQINAMIAAIRQDPLDADLLRDLLGQQSDRMVDVQSKARDALILQIQAMTPERRAAFADKLEEELSRPRRQRRSGG